jgi:hypothetical protein
MYRDHEPIQNVQQEQKEHAEHKTLRCANCDIEFQWPPTIVRGKTYCCTGCANGGPCCCDYSLYNVVNISGVIHYAPDVEKKSVDSQRS